MRFVGHYKYILQHQNLVLKALATYVLKNQNCNLPISRYLQEGSVKKFDIDSELSNFETKSKEIGTKLGEYNQHLFSDKVLLKFREIVNNKDDWKPYTFRELVNNLNKSETKPLENGIDKFVGLEHISSETFQIQGYGLIKDGTSFTKRFFLGNVLFSKRRSYLKKVAVADFEGICSGDILVFEVKKEKAMNYAEAILYDGELSKDDEIAIANFLNPDEPIITKIRIL